ncbi:hypothetical protein DXG01_015513, partial [Tephrocybe rancida]
VTLLHHAERPQQPHAVPSPASTYHGTATPATSHHPPHHTERSTRGTTMTTTRGRSTPAPAFPCHVTTIRGTTDRRTWYRDPPPLLHHHTRTPAAATPSSPPHGE